MTAINDGAGAATFDDVVRLEKSERVLGGADDSPANRHGLANARRTRYILNLLTGLRGQPAWTQVVVTANGNFTVPLFVYDIFVEEAVAAGGGGAGTWTLMGANGSTIGSGGGEGARAENVHLAVTPGEVIYMTLGVGGAYGVAETSATNSPPTPPTAAVQGANGTDTSIGTHLTLQGGRGGKNGGLTGDSSGGLGGRTITGGMVFAGHQGNRGTTDTLTQVDARGGGRGGATPSHSAAAVDGGGGAGTGNVYANGTSGGPGVIRFSYMTVAFPTLP